MFFPLFSFSLEEKSLVIEVHVAELCHHGLEVAFQNNSDSPCHSEAISERLYIWPFEVCFGAGECRWSQFVEVRVRTFGKWGELTKKLLIFELMIVNTPCDPMFFFVPSGCTGLSVIRVENGRNDFQPRRYAFILQWSWGKICLLKKESFVILNWRSCKNKAFSSAHEFLTRF